MHGFDAATVAAYPGGMRHRIPLLTTLASAALLAPIGSLPALAEKGGAPAAPPGQAAPAPDAKMGPGDKPSTMAPDSPAARAKLLDDLYAHLATAEDQVHAQPIMDAIEKLWLYSGSDTVNVLMDRAAGAINAKRFDLALRLLDTVVELAPDYAEGWNRRAYVFFSDNDTGRALGDLRRVLALEPNHYKALEGLGQILKDIGQKKAALKAFKELLEINPNSSSAKQSADELQREVEGQGI